MKRIAVFIATVILCSSVALANDKRRLFRLSIPQVTVVENSLYNKIQFVDTRQQGDLDTGQLEVDGSSLNSQLNVLMTKLIDASAGDKVLLFQLRNMTLEKDKKNDGKPVSYLRISFYEKVNDRYFFINTVDEKIAIDKPKMYMDIISDAIAGYLADNLVNEYTEPTPYDMSGVEDIDSYEKMLLKAYTTNMFADGIYLTFKDFVNQTPADKMVFPSFKKDELKEVKYLSLDNKKVKLDPIRAYAVVVDGRPYITIKKKYVPLRKEDNEFYFEDEISTNNLAVSPTFGIGIGSGGYSSGGLSLNIFSNSQKSKVGFKIDHLNGNKVPMFIIQ